MKRYHWTIAIDVAAATVADGLAFDDALAQRMVERAFPLCSSREITARVLLAPDLADVRAEQGYPPGAAVTVTAIPPLVADLVRAIASVGAARAESGRSSDMCNALASEDLARNLAQGIMGEIDQAFERGWRQAREADDDRAAP